MRFSDTYLKYFTFVFRFGPVYLLIQSPFDGEMYLKIWNKTIFQYRYVSIFGLPTLTFFPLNYYFEGFKIRSKYL